MERRIRKGKRRLIIAVICFAAILLISGCSKPKQAQYEFTDGDSRSYKLWMTQQVELDGDRDSAQRVVVRYDLDLAVGKVEADGAARLALKLLNVQASLSGPEGRKPLSHLDDLKGLSIIMSMKPDGHLLDMKHEGKVSDSLAPTVDSLKRSLRELFPTLPERFSQGTAWSRTTTVEDIVPPYGALKTKTVSSFEVASKTTIDGFEVVELPVRFRIGIGEAEFRKIAVPAPGKSKQGIAASETASEMAVDGKGEGKGSVYFSPGEGFLVAASYDTEITIRSRTKQGDKINASLQKVRSHIELKTASRKKREKGARP